MFHLPALMRLNGMGTWLSIVLRGRVQLARILLPRFSPLVNSTFPGVLPKCLRREGHFTTRTCSPRMIFLKDSIVMSTQAQFLVLQQHILARWTAIAGSVFQRVLHVAKAMRMKLRSLTGGSTGDQVVLPAQAERRTRAAGRHGHHLAPVLTQALPVSWGPVVTQPAQNRLPAFLITMIRQALRWHPTL